MSDRQVQIGGLRCIREQFPIQRHSFLMLAEAYLAEDTTPLTEEQARELVASNLCRCTGYQGIIEAVLATARARRPGRKPTDEA